MLVRLAWQGVMSRQLEVLNVAWTCTGPQQVNYPEQLLVGWGLW